jgi:hypothetical protein
MPLFFFFYVPQQYYKSLGEVSQMALTRYNIGDRLYASCYSDFDFGVEIEVLAISNLELATEYEDILRKLFNSDNAQENYQKLREETVYFYICKVLRSTTLYAEGSKVVLCDALIKENESYYIEESFSLNISASFNTQTSSFRYQHEFVRELQRFFDSHGVIGEISEIESADKQREQELLELRSLVNSLKGLKGAERIVDKILQLNNIEEKV